MNEQKHEVTHLDVQLTNCEGKMFKVGDKISGLLGFGTVVTGEIITVNGAAGIMLDNDEFCPLDDFEGGFELADKEKSDSIQIKDYKLILLSSDINLYAYQHVDLLKNTIVVEFSNNHSINIVGFDHDGESFRVGIEQQKAIMECVVGKYNLCNSGGGS